MTLSDTAEYWQDVREYFTNRRRTFVHILGVDCGHHHGNETLRLRYVDCHACRKLYLENEDLRERVNKRFRKSRSRWVKAQLAKIGRNKYSGKCGGCSIHVDASCGLLQRKKGRWRVLCVECQREELRKEF